MIFIAILAAAAIAYALALHGAPGSRLRAKRRRQDAIVGLLTTNYLLGATQEEIGHALGYPYLDPRLAEDLLTLADAGRIQRGYQTSPGEPSLRRTCWRLADPARTAGRRVTP